MPSRIGVIERADVDLVDDGVLVPELVLRYGQRSSLPQFHFLHKMINAVFRAHAPPDAKDVRG